MNEKVAVIASGVAAFLASLCCLGPLLLGGIGLGVALGATFESLRPYFLGVTAVLLAFGFYLAYRKPKAAACADESCAPAVDRGQKFARPFLWIAAVVVFGLALFPVYGARLVPTVKHPGQSPAPTNEANSAQVTFKVSGMTCEMCAVSVQSALLKLPGVTEAKVDVAGAAAYVRYDPDRVKPNQLIEAVNATGFKASL